MTMPVSRSSNDNDQRPKIKMETKIKDVYPILHELSSTMALRMLLHESMHSRGALIACRFPGRLPQTKSSPPSTISRNHRLDQYCDVDTTKAAAPSPPFIKTVMIETIEEHHQLHHHRKEDHYDDNDDAGSGLSTLSSQPDLELSNNVLTPRNLADQFSAITLESRNDL
mmetsp:Transcript_55285/g.134284  ORF Transcript_55285/g.134284 Transcript_55285/m.134284 type:complete len:169 (+) Transcript_55285:1914-2420(+)